jgi:hypothetical protein
MYKLTTEKWGTVIIRVSDDTFIPLDPNNTDYQKFLDNINEQGNEIVEGDIPEHVLAEAATKKFNYQLAQYVSAIDRLNHYVLSEGCAETKQMMATGEQVFNEETLEMEPVFVEVTAQSSIDPLPLTVEVSEMNDITMEMVITTVDNPAVVQDLEQRAAAQAVVDAAPELVVAAYENTLG